MLQKTSHELHYIQSHGAPPVAVALAVAEENRMVFDLDDALMESDEAEKRAE